MSRRRLKAIGWQQITLSITKDRLVMEGQLHQLTVAALVARHFIKALDAAPLPLIARPALALPRSHTGSRDLPATAASRP